MGIGGAIVSGAGVVSGGLSKYGSSRFNQRMYDTNAGFAEQQAAFSEQQAVDATKRGEEQENFLRTKIRQAIGTARAAYAGQGIEVNDGTAKEVQASIAWTGERDALTIRNNAAREAWGYRTQAWAHRVDAWNYKQGAILEKTKQGQILPETILGLANVGYSGGLKGGGGSSGGTSFPNNFGVGAGPRGDN